MSRLPAQPRLPQNVRQRRLADGSTRIWWEPSARARELGFASVQLDPARLTWSSREAEKLNRELDQALKTGRRPAPVTNGGRTIEALIDSYTRSSHFRRRPEKTQRSYQAQFRMILAKWGPSNVADFSKPVMHAWYDALLEEKGDYTAIARLRHMSILFSHAELIGWRAEGSNPCSKLKMAVPKGAGAPIAGMNSMPCSSRRAASGCNRWSQPSPLACCRASGRQICAMPPVVPSGSSRCRCPAGMPPACAGRGS